jgi:hypothetical protein
MFYASPSTTPSWPISDHSLTALYDSIRQAALLTSDQSHIPAYRKVNAAGGVGVGPRGKARHIPEPEYDHNTYLQLRKKKLDKFVRTRFELELDLSNPFGSVRSNVRPAP